MKRSKLEKDRELFELAQQYHKVVAERDAGKLYCESMIVLRLNVMNAFFPSRFSFNSSPTKHVCFFGQVDAPLCPCNKKVMFVETS